MALITGVTRVIGKAVERLFAKQGVYIFVTDISNALGKSGVISLLDNGKYLHLEISKPVGW